MSTGLTLPNDLYAAPTELEWWVTSIPPYYCSSTGGAGNDDFSTDLIWLGTSFTANGQAGPPVKYTNGVKFAFTTADQQAPGSQVTFEDPNGGPSPLNPLNQQGGTYSTPYLQDTYRVSNKGEPLAFGPYPLNKTNASLSPLISDGDIMFITTGSDVIGGSNAGTANSAADSRQFNLIFYSTGSANVVKLSGYVGNTNQTGRLSSQSLPDFTPTVRAEWYNDTGVTGFVGIRSVASATQVTWWPLTYDQSNVLNIISRNDS